jgi:hypothetical protein
MAVEKLFTWAWVTANVGYDRNVRGDNSPTFSTTQKPNPAPLHSGAGFPNDGDWEANGANASTLDDLNWRNGAEGGPVKLGFLQARPEVPKLWAGRT